MEDSAAERSTPGFRIRKQQRRRLPWIVVAALVVVVAVVVAVRRLTPERVAATAVMRRDVARTLVLTGRVRPRSRPRVGSNLAGTVREVLVHEGEHVAPGQLLLRLDDAPQRAALAQAQAAFASARGSAQSAVDVAERAAQSARRDAERARALFSQGAISLREQEEADQRAANAEAELAAAGARSGGSPRDALAEVARARAAVDAAQAQLALTSVRASTPGTVLTRNVEPGDAVLPGKILLEMALDGATELVAFAREENLADLAVGARAVASADAFPDSTFAARLSWLAPVVDPAQGTVEARFSVADPPRYLRADMTISVNVDVERRAGALVVPRLLIGDIGTAEPWVVVARAGRAERRQVQLGTKGERDVEILAGLTADDRVLPADATPGSRVRVVVR